MNIPLNLKFVANDCFQGPAAINFDFKECRFSPTFYTYDNSEKSFARVLEAMKREAIPERGIFRWYRKQYGPVILDQMGTTDFNQLDSCLLTERINDLIDGIDQQFFGWDGPGVDRELVKHKIAFILRLIPVDLTVFFEYGVPVNRTNGGSTKVLEHHPFSYFHSLIGYNEEKFYLLTIFYQ